MAKRKTKTTSAPKRQRSPAQEAVHDAGKITGDLINALQTVRKSFLRVGQLLTEVRDCKHYLALHDADVETYASKRLGLSKTSTYRFMRVYAWAKEHHPEWLDPEKKVRIPNLFEIEGIVWIEKELAEKKTDPARKEELEALKKKALAGKLPKKNLQAVQRRASKTDKGERKLISATRALRKRYAESKSVKAQESVPLFDRIIANMESDAVLETAALSILDDWFPKADRAKFFSRNMQYA